MAPGPFFWCFLVLSVVACTRAQSTDSNFTSAAATSVASTGSSSHFSSSASASASSFSSVSALSSAASNSSSIIRSSTSSFSSASQSSSSSTSVTSTATSSKSSSARSSVPTSSRPTSSHTTAVLIQTTPTPSATPSPTPEPVPITTSDPSPSVNTNQQVDAASNGFWSNKGAVGGTFTVIALVIVGLLVAVVVVLRRRVARRKSARDTFFDTNTLEAPHSGRVSPGPSLISLGNQPMDAHSTPIPNYGTAYLVDTADYSITYPPGTSYPVEREHDTRQYHSAQPTAPISQPTASDPNFIGEQDPYYADYYAANSGLNYQQPFSHPQATGASAAARGLPGRDSGYQQSIDSFYGAAGTAL